MLALHIGAEESMQLSDEEGVAAEVFVEAMTLAEW